MRTTHEILIQILNLFYPRWQCYHLSNVGLFRLYYKGKYFSQNKFDTEVVHCNFVLKPMLIREIKLKSISRTIFYFTLFPKRTRGKQQVTFNFENYLCGCIQKILPAFSGLSCSIWKFQTSWFLLSFWANSNKMFLHFQEVKGRKRDCAGKHKKFLTIQMFSSHYSSQNN